MLNKKDVLTMVNFHVTKKLVKHCKKIDIFDIPEYHHSIQKYLS